ncbi:MULTISPECIES: hypothetical protein [unclassified Arthrobacter]|uniref:hypothetical protein n=1 Tax=unclassified Arthrobacter TaxID=235627 RepID=UPI002DF9171B|nr:MULTISPECIES: hypothetical protein [unclassified Arthrobacter]MEC5191905.1 hypothetical protein [Arthrobacter sp. MP_M4]MEC5202410.1 hypothetical protein [Arthrobacter sp. MP_M7]
MTGSHGPGGYRLRVEGHLDDHWSASFGHLTLTRENDGTTSLRGQVADQAALHGLLTRIRDLGIVLISVEAIDVTDEIGSKAGGATTRQSEPIHHARVDSGYPAKP